MARLATPQEVETILGDSEEKRKAVAELFEKREERRAKVKAELERVGVSQEVTELIVKAIK